MIIARNEFFVLQGKSVMVQAVTGGGDSSGPPAEQVLRTILLYI